MIPSAVWVVASFIFARSSSRESGDLDLFGSELADLLAGLLTVEDAGVAPFAPFPDQRGVQAFATQVRASAATLTCLFLGGQVGELVGGTEGASWSRALGSGMRRVHPVIVLDRHHAGNRHRRVDPHLALQAGLL
ncbi:hypothetical protein [Rhodococcus opacus]|uniref:hypothetical protein n=1 Tax=Rhodococcus opacus TaxID=37919 RepID=UPI0011C3B03E|nr:hypothetical protein [Rhodococcus opacus]QZS52569.1 hypothetical protein FXW36_02975 [Rhodococcus opacus]